MPMNSQSFDPADESEISAIAGEIPAFDLDADHGNPAGYDDRAAIDAKVISPNNPKKRLAIIGVALLAAAALGGYAIHSLHSPSPGSQHLASAAEDAEMTSISASANSVPEQPLKLAATALTSTSSAHPGSLAVGSRKTPVAMATSVVLPPRVASLPSVVVSPGQVRHDGQGVTDGADSETPSVGSTAASQLPPTKVVISPAATAPLGVKSDYDVVVSERNSLEKKSALDSSTITQLRMALAEAKADAPPATRFTIKAVLADGVVLQAGNGTTVIAGTGTRVISHGTTLSVSH